MELEMKIKAKVPSKLSDRKSETFIVINVESSKDDSVTYWLVQLTGNKGIESLNYWIGTERYDNSVMAFSTYDRMMEYLAVLKKDMEKVWANYNKGKM